MSQLRELANELEDILQDFKSTTNGFSVEERTTNICSYGAILHFTRVEAAIKANPDKDWLAACEVWEHDSYLSPVLKLLVIYIQRTLNT